MYLKLYDEENDIKYNFCKAMLCFVCIVLLRFANILQL